VAAFVAALSTFIVVYFHDSVEPHIGLGIWHYMTFYSVFYLVLDRIMSEDEGDDN
jgi:hypothetical protein